MFSRTEAEKEFQVIELNPGIQGGIQSITVDEIPDKPYKHLEQTKPDIHKRQNMKIMKR